MASVACCTCATIISDYPSTANFETKNEKQFSTPDDKRLDCCSRVICGTCIHKNPRFASYCPYCQIASNPSNPLPAGGLREPPSYDFATSKAVKSCAPPPPPPAYTTTTTTSTLLNEKTKNSSADADEGEADDIIHFLAPTDTLPSLALRYHIPPHALRAHNRLAADSLLPARKYLRIPVTANTPNNMVSLSPTPVESEAEAARKTAIRRWMVACKCADYEVAELYLGQSGGEVGEAVERFLADEEWERGNPVGGRKGKERERERGGGGVWARQVAFWRRG